jgi:hypothetical protein
MAIFDKVLPGDLIRADLINTMIDKITTLETKVEALETSAVASSRMHIDAILPVGPIHVGDEIRVVGRNFGIPSLAVVTIDTERIDGWKFKPGSSDSLLVFDVPPVGGLGTQGKSVTLSVSNATDFASTAIVLFPAEETLPRGNLLITLVPPAPAMTAGTNPIFNFKILAFTNIEESYTLTPTLVPDVALAGWSAAMVDGGQVVIPASPQPDGTTTPVRVRVSIPANAPLHAIARLTLNVKSVRNPAFYNDSAEVKIDVGGQLAVSDKIQPAFSKVYAPGTGDATGVKIPVTTDPNAPKKVQVDISVLLVDVDSYATTQPITVDNDPNRLWNVQAKGVASWTTAAPNANPTLSLVIWGQTNAPDTRLVLKIASTTKPAVATEFPLKIALK